MKRLFFGIYPDLPANQLLQRIQAQTACAGKPTAPQNFHVTLIFVGEREDAELGRIERAAASVSVPPFTLRLEHYDVFKRIGLLACVPARTPVELLSLHKRLLGALRECGVHIRSRLYPHLTLFRKIEGVPAERELPAAVEWRVASFALVESSLRPDKAHYRIVREYKLRV